MCLCDRLLVTKCPKTQFKIGSLPSYLIDVDTGSGSRSGLKISEKVANVLG